jgi:hypothetical protein
MIHSRSPSAPSLVTLACPFAMLMLRLNSPFQVQFGRRLASSILHVMPKTYFLNMKQRVLTIFGNIGPNRSPASSPTNHLMLSC